MIKKILLAVLSIFIITAFYILNTKKDNLYQYKLNGKSYRLLVADEKEEHEKGLMFYKDKKELKGADGMIFIFSEKQTKTFWNKNTYLDLDVYWVDGEQLIGKSFLPSILISKDIVFVNSEKKVDRVIEIINN